MRTAQRPLQLLDALLLLGIGPRGRASPPKRSLGSFFHFIFPAIVKRRGNLVLAARLSHVAALQTFQHNLPLLFRSSLNFRLSRHSRLLAEAPSLTNFRVQFYRDALHKDGAPPVGMMHARAIEGRPLAGMKRYIHAYGVARGL